MAINFSPAVGEILECDFGDFVNPPLNPIFNGLISPEIVKKRMVVILNGRLPNECCLVIPVSSAGNNQNSVDRGFHVHLPPNLFTVTRFFDRRDRWAISECMTHVSKKRLFAIRNGSSVVKDILPRDVVTKIQKAAIKSLNATVLLAPPAPAIERKPALEVAEA
ncbi:type II toxin-antitoxin system PemK/MazF family toxin [Pseudomonas putida]|uniref:type II toxin-antitoxin system PemK/MazF family toxin n=1 Tax=Pseudomonas putida TaxID=303 RepID=UPI0018AA712B|nr:type II toxin-antitoxin system PemK/MazF family toxin [Pseudomonas putida]MBF8657676.1 type II toxin-antitoxin system PemK/MazF family toxin [Pseudomonas putida]